MAGLSRLVKDADSLPERVARAELLSVHKLIDDGVKKSETEEEAEKQKSKAKMFRVSSIGHCLRKVYYGMKHKVEHPPDLMRKFNVGSAVHSMYQRYLMLTGRFLGNYYCAKCGMFSGPMYYTTGLCANCQFGGYMRYEELTMINRKRRIAGSPDGFLKLRVGENDKAFLVELKTITPYYKIAEKSNVTKFVPEHLHQANFYLGLVFDQQTYLDVGDIDILRQNLNPNKFFMIYHDKGDDKKHVHKFDFDKDMYSSDKARVRSFWNSWGKGHIPDKDVSSKCKYCDFLSECSKKTWRDNKDNG